MVFKHEYLNKVYFTKTNVDNRIKLEHNLVVSIFLKSIDKKNLICEFHAKSNISRNDLENRIVRTIITLNSHPPKS